VEIEQTSESLNSERAPASQTGFEKEINRLTAKDKLIIALDVESPTKALNLVRELQNVAGMFKVGSQLFTATGPQIVRDIIALNAKVFLDLKFHDIPHQVAGAARSAAELGVSLFTIHASGGSEMMEAAVRGMGGEGVLAVTMLTSLSQFDLETIGVPALASDHVVSLASLAADSKTEGVVCSPEEIRRVKDKEPSLLVFTPGVRPVSSDVDDQRRVATPERARADGADFLVIGRPITRAPDPAAAARDIATAIGLFER
jgi:orotidine-5'-phosphate decarboxylase